MWNLKRNDTNELTYQTEADSQTQRRNLWLLGERMGERDNQGVWDGKYTLLYLRWRTNKDLLYRQGTLHNAMWQPDGRRVWGRVDAHIWMAESLHCSPGAVIVLLIGYTPIWQPDGRRVWGRVDTCVWMAESLCCSPETTTTLLIG